MFGSDDSHEKVAAETELLHATLEGIDDVVIAVGNGSRRVLLCNRMVLPVFGYAPEDLEGGTTEILHVDHDHFLRFAEISEPVLHHGEAFHTEYPMRRKDGEIFFAEITVTPVGSIKNTGSRVVSVIHDTTQRRVMTDTLHRTAAALEERVKELKLLYSVVTLSADPDLEVHRFLADTVLMIPASFQFPASTHARITSPYGVFESLAFTETRNSITEPIASGADDPIGELSVFLADSAADSSWFLDEEKRMIAALAARCAETIGHIEARAELNERRNQLAAVFEGSTDSFFIIDDDRVIVDTNPAACALLGYERERVVGMRFDAYLAPGDSDGFADTTAVDTMWQTLLSSGTLRTAIVLIAESGRRIDAEVSAVAHFVPGRHLGVVRDMTDHKKTETSLRDALSEREILLKEIHHRVKNNLQVILSLLSMQTEQLRDTGCERHLVDAGNRVRSMGLVHEQLLASERLNAIEMPPYMKSLVSWLVQSISANSAECAVRCDPIRLAIDQAVPCGLIVTELVGNAIRHAFPGRERGNITVEMRADSDDAVRITVTDDGVGLPEGFTFESPRSLGATLVKSAIQQLGGEITLETGANGSAIRVQFRPQPT